MSNEVYDATYAAVSAKISHCNPSQIFEQAARGLDVSFYANQVAEHIKFEVSNVAQQLVRPSVLFRPELTRLDLEPGKYFWVVKYGACSVQGNTPEEAMANFDKAWTSNQ